MNEILFECDKNKYYTFGKNEYIQSLKIKRSALVDALDKGEIDQEQYKMLDKMIYDCLNAP